MDDSLVSEGTRARQRAASQLAGVARFPPATGASDAAMALDENAATPHRVSRARDAGERRLRDLNARSASLEAAAKALKSGAMRAGEREEGRTGGARVSADASEKSDTLEKWRAIQTWASVDSVEASQGRGAGARERANDDLPVLPESLSPITQIAEPPVRVELGAVQPALERTLRFDARGDADDDVSASPRPAWATPPTRQDEALRGDEDGRTRDLSADVADLVRTPESNANKENPPNFSSVAAAAERFHSFAAPPVDARNAANGDVDDTIDVMHPKLQQNFHFELEVTRRREREARDAIDKMDRAVSTMRDERDAARERSANDRAALAAASRREADARSDAEEARTQFSEMRARLRDANIALDKTRDEARRLEKRLVTETEAEAKKRSETEAELAATREALSSERDSRRAALEAASKDEAKRSDHARRASAALAADAAANTKRADDAEKREAETARRLTESQRSLERVADAAGRQLETLREEVSVLRARLSARTVSDAEMARMRAETAEARETARKSAAGVEGAVACALARARDTLRSAAAE